jgi:hypothetical protein
METKSKMFSLFDDEEFAKDAIDCDSGIMINQHKDVLNFLILTFEDRFEVYLELFDDGEPPYRDILGVGIAETLEAAKAIAVANLNRQAYSQLN